MTERASPSSSASLISASNPQNPSASEWATSRGEKWRTQISGMEAMLRPVDEPLIHALRLDAPCRVADVGCGGGGTTLEIRRRAPAGSVVCGFDISPGLIDLARDRVRKDERVTFDVADVANAPPPAEPFDRLVSRFGIMFFADPALAFTNLFRWLAPGGRFAFAAWGPLAENPWMTTVRDVAAESVDIPSPDPEAPGAFRYATEGKLVTLLDRAGFDEIAVHDWRGALAIAGALPAAEAATFALAAFASFGELLAEAGDAALHRARQSLTARFTPHEESGAVRLNASVHIFTGARPRA